MPFAIKTIENMLILKFLKMYTPHCYFDTKLFNNFLIINCFFLMLAFSFRGKIVHENTDRRSQRISTCLF